MADRPINWSTLWRLATERFSLGPTSVHGPHHWRQVERNAIELAAETQADQTVVRLFAVFHDSCRQNESHDPQHGSRAIEWAATLRGVAFDLDDTQFVLLSEACIGHDRGLICPEPTIGTCWDADRLDLVRVGMRPSADYMSTAAGRSRAARGWPFVR